MQAALVKSDVAAVETGLPVARLLALADGGERGQPGLLWVWNVAVNPTGHRRDLRFWLPELRARRAGKTLPGELTIAALIGQILPPNRARFHAGEVDQLFQMRHRTRIDLGDALPAAGREAGRNFYTRTALAQFLSRRWLGNLGIRGT